MKKGLDDLGWRDSARTWGRRVAREMAVRMEEVEDALKARSLQFAGPMQFIASEVREDCSSCRERTQQAQETLARLKETLLDADPLEAPTWVRHRAEELTRLEGVVGALPVQIERSCNRSRVAPPVPPNGMGWVALAMALLSLLWVSWFLSRTVRLERRGRELRGGNR